MKFLTVFLFVLIFSIIVIGQPNTTSLDGLVIDADGAVFSFINVRAVLLENEENERTFTTTADMSGRFLFAELPYGKYRLEAQFKSEEFIVKKWLDLRHFKNTGKPLVLVWGPCESEEDKDKNIQITKQELSALAMELLESYTIQTKDSLINTKRIKIDLSMKNLEKFMLPQSFLTGFDLLSEKDIKEKTEVINGFEYLSISDVIIKNGCAAISIGYYQQKMTSFYADYITYEYRKRDGAWKQTYKFKSFAESL